MAVSSSTRRCGLGRELGVAAAGVWGRVTVGTEVRRDGGLSVTVRDAPLPRI